MATGVQTTEPAFFDNAMRTLRARYLRHDQRGKVIETPRELLERVAATVAAAESAYGASRELVDWSAREFYEAMARREFLPNSPTLMNAGRSLGMLSACFVLPVDDSIEGIFDAVKYTAQIQKAGGGTGFSFDRLRPTGDWISSSGGRTSGPISFWRVFREATRAIQQGAFRRGANMGMMSVWHPDILRFATAKNDLGEFENFNISIKVPDEFMAALKAEPDAPHGVTNPHTGKRYFLPRSLDVRNYAIQDLLEVDGGPPLQRCYSRHEVWDLIVRGAWATGEPGVCFIDRVNAANPTPHVGRIEATNPCGEQPLLDYEACNLGSINLVAFVGPSNGRPVLDERALRKAIRMGVRFLDDVIDVNNYIVPEIRRQCMGNRKIGLGYMGFADALFELGIRYDSEEGLAFGRRVATLLAQEAAAAGEELARARGSFPNWPGSTWDTVWHRPMRNAAITTIAPTGTISIIAGCSGGIEPAFSLAFYRHILEGQEMLEVSAPFERYARRKGFWSERLAGQLAAGARLRDIPDVPPEAADLFVTAHDVSPEMHVRMQAAFQEHIDGAISKTINLHNSATVADVEKVYLLAYELGCKGVTVYRDKCREGQPMTTLDQPTPGLCPRCHGPLPDESGCVRCPTCGATLCS